MLHQKSREQYKVFLDKNMHRFSEPGVYLGSEPNTFQYTDEQWNNAQLRVVWASSWPYAQVPGNQSIPLLYRLVGDGRPEMISERCYAWNTKEDLKVFKQSNMPMFSLETRHPIYDFDVICTSLGYPPYIGNFIQMLRTAGISPRRVEREQFKGGCVDPIIIVGGSLYGSPEPWAPIVDIVFVGEAEDEPDNPGLLAVLDTLVVMKANGDLFNVKFRQECLHKLAVEFPFLYMPAFHQPIYNDEMGITGWSKKYEDIVDRPRVRLVRDFDKVTALLKPVVPFTDTSMGLGEVESQRGCPSFCTFCAVTFRRKPPAAKSARVLAEQLRENIKWGGALEAFPTSYDFSSYPYRNELIKILLEEVISNVDTQSNRIDEIASAEQYLKLMCLSGMDQLVVALEGNSQRLRDYTNKHATGKGLLDVCEAAFRFGFRRLKIYMIANLPPETDEDTQEIWTLLEQINALKAKYQAKTSIRLSYTPLLVESNTPMQWDVCTLDKRSLEGFNKRMREMGIEFSLGKKTERNYYVHTQVFHLADRIAADAILDTYLELEATYMGGVDRSFAETLDKNLKNRGIEKGVYHYFSAKPIGTKFGAQIIDLGFKSNFMEEFAEEAWKVYRGEQSLNERGFIKDKCSVKCHMCGCCSDAETIKRMNAWRNHKDIEINMSDIKIIDDNSIRQKLWVKFWTPESHRWVYYDHWAAQIRRAAYINSFPIAIKSVKIFSSIVKFHNWTSGVDFAEFAFHKPGFYKKSGKLDFIQAMNKWLVHARILDVEEVPVKTDVLKKVGDVTWYQVAVDENLDNIKRVKERWDSGEKFEVVVKEDVHRRGIVTERFDMHDFLKGLWFIRSYSTIFAHLLIKGKPNPYAIIAGLFDQRMSQAIYHNAEVQDILIYPEHDTLAAVNCGDDCEEDVPSSLIGGLLNHEGEFVCPRHLSYYFGDPV